MSTGTKERGVQEDMRACEALTVSAVQTPLDPSTAHLEPIS